ncbi:uncharacterized protein [Rutidosis leptorrhynchoides]|uniref:uncharacterized protein n=1 Tax=Rutidosis leptorrhynchoides TaxID=125765 RepID=UPI003A98D9A9
MHWSSWESILASKENGGLSIGSLNSFNLSLLLKRYWRATIIPNSPWVRLLKTIHGDSLGFDDTRCTTVGVWNSIVTSVKHCFLTNLIPPGSLHKRIGNSCSTSLYSDKWLGNFTLASRYNRLFKLDSNPLCLVQDRINENGFTWSWLRYPPGSCHLLDLLNDLQVVNITDHPDTWIWKIENNGLFTVKGTREFIDRQLLPSSQPCTRWIKALPSKKNVGPRIAAVSLGAFGYALFNTRVIQKMAISEYIRKCYVYRHNLHTIDYITGYTHNLMCQ